MIRRAFTEFWGYLRTPASRSAEAFGDEIAEEIAFHIEARTLEYQQQGMSLEAAQQAAHRRFGNPARVAADCHTAAIGGLILWHRLHLAMTAGLALTLGWVWWTTARTNMDLTATTARVPPGIAAMLDHDWTGDVTGQIVDDQDGPIEAANVLVVVKTWPDQSYFQRAYVGVSDSQGRFLIPDVHPINERYEVQITAVATGRALKSSYHSELTGVFEPVVLKLPPSPGFAVQVESDQGVKLPNIEVLPQSRIEASGTRHLIYFDSAQSLVSHTDNAGRVELPYFQPGDTAGVLLRTPHGDWQPHDIKVPPAGQIATIRTAL
jgi:hypothetical protein